MENPKVKTEVGDPPNLIPGYPQEAPPRQSKYLKMDVRVKIHGILMHVNFYIIFENSIFSRSVGPRGLFSHTKKKGWKKIHLQVDGFYPSTRKRSEKVLKKSDFYYLPIHGFYPCTTQVLSKNMEP